MGKRINTAKWMENQGRWQIKVQKNGERRTFTSSLPGRAGQRECNARADAWLDNNISRANTKLSDLYDEYIGELKITTSKGHWTNYEGYGEKWIKPYIGRIKAQNLSEQHLQTIINRAYNAGLAKKTLSNIKGCMIQFVKFCRKNNATTLYPESLKIPRDAKTTERTILQPDDLNILFQNSKTVCRGKVINEIFIHAYRFEVLTGLRPGELFGIENQDIQNDVVHLRRSINRFGDVTRGKNENARRNFKLTPLAIQTLKDQKNMLKSLGIISKYVFPDEHGEAIYTSKYYKHWVRYRDYHGLSKAHTYELRHTFVSIVKTLPEGLLKSVVGHSKDMDTYGVYSHEVQGDMEITAQKIESIFEGIFQKKAK